MKIEFRTHLLADGLFRNPRITSDTGVIHPGSLITWLSAHPRAAGGVRTVRRGLVVAIVDGSVHMAWNAWSAAHPNVDP